MSAALTSYMSQYASLNAEITASISRLHRAESHEISGQLQKIEKSLEEVEELFEQMELEIRQLGDEDQRTRLNLQLKGFQAEWKRLKTEYDQVKNRRGSSSRPSSSDDYNDNAKASQNLLNNTETMERSSRKLEQGHNLLVESEDIGASILNDLSVQRETLQRSRNRLRDTDDDLGTSSRILSGMIMRIQQSKVVLALVVVAIVATILIGIYFSFEG